MDMLAIFRRSDLYLHSMPHAHVMLCTYAKQSAINVCGVFMNVHVIVSHAFIKTNNAARRARKLGSPHSWRPRLVPKHEAAPAKAPGRSQQTQKASTGKVHVLVSTFGSGLSTPVKTLTNSG